jgi:DNA-binding response OmpR family regulator
VGGRVLLVEDEEDVRETLLEILEDEGFEVRGAANAHEALAVVGEEGWVPDCVVTDLKMPGMTGQELALELRRLHPGMAIVLASGYHPDSLPGLDRSLFLEKPFKISEFLDAVQSLLGPSQPEEAPS